MNLVNHIVTKKTQKVIHTFDYVPYCVWGIYYINIKDMIFRRVIKVGNSLCVAIPAEYCHSLGICRGDNIGLVIGNGGHIIIIQIPEKGNIDFTEAQAEELPEIQI